MSPTTLLNAPEKEKTRKQNEKIDLRLFEFFSRVQQLHPRSIKRRQQVVSSSCSLEFLILKEKRASTVDNALKTTHIKPSQSYWQKKKKGKKKS